MIVGIAVASQSLVTAEVKIIMPNLETDQGPIHVAHNSNHNQGHHIHSDMGFGTRL